jgi:hypothetical protein
MSFFKQNIQRQPRVRKQKLIRLDVQSNSEIRIYFAYTNYRTIFSLLASLSARLILRHFPSVYKIAILTAKTTFQSSIRETQMRRTKLFLENFFMHVFSCFVRTSEQSTCIFNPASSLALWCANWLRDARAGIEVFNLLAVSLRCRRFVFHATQASLQSTRRYVSKMFIVTLRMPAGYQALFSQFHFSPQFLVKQFREKPDTFSFIIGCTVYLCHVVTTRMWWQIADIIQNPCWLTSIFKWPFDPDGR